MTPAQFRKAALALEGVEEQSHMDHPDFRVNGRIFATLNHDETRGMVKVPSELQEAAVAHASGAFEAAAGAWGKGGSTYVHLKDAPAALVNELLHEAWTLARAQKPAKKRAAKASAKKRG